MSAIPKGEIRTKGKRAFILTTCVEAAQKQFSDNWSSQGLMGWSTYRIVQSRRCVVSFRSMTEQLMATHFNGRSQDLAFWRHPSRNCQCLLGGFDGARVSVQMVCEEVGKSRSFTAGFGEATGGFQERPTFHTIKPCAVRNDSSSKRLEQYGVH
jgi:hypothetical protein